MSSNKSSTRTGLGFLEALSILFIALKLCKVIDWSWLWVLSPIWIPTSIVLIVLAIYGCFKLKDKWDQRGTVSCRECEYSGCISSSVLGQVTIRCRKDGEFHYDGYRCKDGERKSTKSYIPKHN